MGNFNDMHPCEACGERRNAESMAVIPEGCWLCKACQKELTGDDTGNIVIWHTCKGSLAIAEETIEACNDNTHTAALVLIFAAALAGEMINMPLQEMVNNLTSMRKAARCLLGKDATAAQVIQ